MRNFVNWALLLFFIVLALTGLLSFFEPFKLLTTRIHIVFGFGVILLVLSHVIDRLRYFRGSIGLRKGKGLSSRYLLSSAALTLLLLFACIGNWWPVRPFIELGHEARNKAIIFRADPFTAFKPLDNGAVLKYKPDDATGVRVEFEWGNAFEQDDGTQIAIWAENSVGMMLKTFFVSEESAFSEELHFDGKTRQRKEVLPVWRNRYSLLIGVDPDGKIDGVSGATPNHSFSIDEYLQAGAQSFYLYVEANKPNDGQPSVIYGAFIENKSAKEYYLLPLVAHGGEPSNLQGHMFYDLERLTTARNIVEMILVRIARNGSPEIN